MYVKLKIFFLKSFSPKSNLITAMCCRLTTQNWSEITRGALRYTLHRLSILPPLSQTASFLPLRLNCCVSLSQWLHYCQHVACTVTRAGGHKSSDGSAVGITEGRGSEWLSKVISLKEKCVCGCCYRECVLFYERSFPSQPPIALLLDCD